MPVKVHRVSMDESGDTSAWMYIWHLWKGRGRKGWLGRPRTILRKLWKASGKVVKPVTCWRSPSSGWNGPALVLTYSAVAGSNLGEPWHPEHSDEPKRWQLRLSGNCVGDQTDTFLGPHTQLFVFPTCSVVTALRVRYQQTIRAVSSFWPISQYQLLFFWESSWDPWWAVQIFPPPKARKLMKTIHQLN